MAYSQDRVQLKSYLEGGYYNGSVTWLAKTVFADQYGYTTRVVDYKQGTMDYFKNRIYWEMNFEAKWKGFTGFTTLLTVSDPEEFYAYQPLQTEYKIGMNYQYRSIMFTSEHMCTHTTQAFLLGGAYTRFGVRLYFINTK